MKIYIMRHGKPDVSALSDKVSSKQLVQCMEIYRNCGILDGDQAEDDSIKLFRQFEAIVVSDLKRSVESALLFSSHQALIIDPVFREIEDTFLPVPFFKLTPLAWGKIFILLWFVGIFRFNKAFKEGKVRAKICAKKLVELAEQHEKVLLVGHGFMNGNYSPLKSKESKK